jgi:hypothetical protein
LRASSNGGMGGAMLVVEWWWCLRIRGRDDGVVVIVEW